jgi:rod shape-determining protein MreC
LVGRIAAVTASAARVQLITDPISNINVRLEPSQSEAVVSGQITGEIALDMIPIDSNLQPGDLVLTSGYGGNYPADILIGQVSGVRKRDYELFQTASIQPAVDFSQLRIVMVITNFNPVDLDPLLP